ncbi:MAG: hypothetical protein HYZ24_03260 [Chloroflexi bacterium]|nr:hypothetical protein [Chloroflexota bacterium]
MISYRWRIVLIGVSTAFISFALRDSIQRNVIIPLAYLWWLFKLYYRAVPQLILWSALVIVAFASMIRLVPIKNLFRRTRRIELNPAMGPVENIALWIKKSPGGVYYKWLIANRLGRVARELLDQREGRIRKGFTRLNGKGWNPPPEVGEYLETGLNGSFADFPQTHWWKPTPTKLDVDPEQAVEYLENELEISHDRHRKNI